ncbi:MAG: hypothetical protein NC242_11950 [Roseburia sp.]|nr:hypothetical protein [Roseburia sp.]MCM1432156.1 hypothetical protein [Muribaculaceae bacterium]
MDEVRLSEEKKKKILQDVEELLRLYHEGFLGGEVMPEDANPGLGRTTKENYLYFTLPMALNYQRNSYKLWEAAKSTYLDSETEDVFIPESVTQMEADDLRSKLLKYKLALQPNKQLEIWRRLCDTFVEKFQGDVRQLFLINDCSVKKTKEYILASKKNFPYLSGTKILNYWLYVMLQYTDVKMDDRQYITVAPDTHVIQASEKLGLITHEESEKPNIREKVSLLWEEVFRETDKCPIDIHTPLWLWSRGGFRVKVGDCRLPDIDRKTF